MAWPSEEGAPPLRFSIGPALPQQGRRQSGGGDRAATSHQQRAPDHHLPRRLAAELPGHDGPVLAARFNASGAYLVTGGRDRTLRLWNPHRAAAAAAAAAGNEAEREAEAEGGGRPPPATPPLHHHQPIKVYRGGHAHEVRDVSVSADSAQLASVGGDRAVVVWDVATGQALRRMDGGGGSGGGNGSRGSGVSLPPPPIPPLSGPTHAVRHHSNGFLLLTGGSDRALRVWDLRVGGGGGGGGGGSNKGGGGGGGGGGACCVQACRPFRDDVTAVAEGPGVAQLCAASVDGTVAVFDCRLGALVVDDVAGGVPVTGLHLPAGGRAVLAACADGRARLLDASEGLMLAEYGAGEGQRRAARRQRRRRRKEEEQEAAAAAASNSRARSRWGPPPPGAPPPSAGKQEDEKDEDEDEEEEEEDAPGALTWVRCATTPPDDGAVVTTSGASLVYWDYATGEELARVARAAGGRGGGGGGGGGRKSSGNGRGGVAAAGRVSALAVAAVPAGDGPASALGFASACCAVTGGTDGRVRVFR
jgi:mitogen-activated protein kinase organizer 1